MAKPADPFRLDATSLRVLAHPLRSRLLMTLRIDGPATATELAEKLETNTGATSYHLRQLEEVGLVRDSGTGSGRRRVWEAATRGHSWEPSDFAGDPDAEASLAWLSDFYRSLHMERADQWARNQRQWPPAWRDALGSGDDAVTLTSEQAVALGEELREVIARYRDLGEDAPGAARLHLFYDLFPFDDEPPQEQS
ncbi:helix-turn-helix domain-containing protein [Nocardioides rotundus]|uniref:ArsR/SmtB family transcription factor n=1 Tax=Nocardioides rotundus TaxID=1774216 RepID=UPI001CBA973B|nr:helix-turn-helix domain-containing protein [Nocardioides rotundus]UAL28968.1 helix-turn-helix domain-containing protein [Nocardioides rotundus]